MPNRLSCFCQSFRLAITCKWRYHHIYHFEKILSFDTLNRRMNYLDYFLFLFQILLIKNLSFHSPLDLNIGKNNHNLFSDANHKMAKEIIIMLKKEMTS